MGWLVSRKSETAKIHVKAGNSAKYAIMPLAADEETSRRH